MAILDRVSPKLDWPLGVPKGNKQTSGRENCEGKSDPSLTIRWIRLIFQLSIAHSLYGKTALGENGGVRSIKIAHGAERVALALGPHEWVLEDLWATKTQDLLSLSQESLKSVIVRHRKSKVSLFPNAI